MNKQRSNNVTRYFSLRVLAFSCCMERRCIAEIHQLMPPEVEQVDDDGYQQGQQAPKHIGIEKSHVLLFYSVQFHFY